MTVLIDSDVLIEVSRDRNTGIRTRVGSTAGFRCRTVAELWHGARSEDHELLDRLFDCFVCIPVDKDIGRRAGDFLRQYARSHGLDLGDALIASTASIHGAQLWTRNRKHPMKDLSFSRQEF